MFKIFLLTISTFSIIACSDSATSTSSVVEKLNVTAFKELMDANADKYVIDVRTDGEVDNGMIQSAVRMDLSRPDFEESITKLDKTKPVFVYCAVGGRSRMAGEIFEKAGFKKVYNLQGGINAWQAAGLPVNRSK